MLKTRDLEALVWEPQWDSTYSPWWMEDDVPTQDELLQMIDQPKSPRLYRALGALGMSYVKETA